MLFLHGGVFQDAAATASCAVLRGPRQKLYSLHVLRASCAVLLCAEITCSLHNVILHHVGTAHGVLACAGAVLGLCWPCVCYFSIQCPVFHFAPSSFMCHPCADIMPVPVSCAGTAGEARVSCMSADHTRMQPAQPWCHQACLSCSFHDSIHTTTIHCTQEKRTSFVRLQLTNRVSTNCDASAKCCGFFIRCPFSLPAAASTRMASYSTAHGCWLLFLLSCR